VLLVVRGAVHPRDSDSEGRCRMILKRETSSLSLRLRFRTDRDGAPAFGSCSAVVRQLSGSCPRFFFGQEKSGFEPDPVVRRQNPASES
jgi:hypothetical protein